MSLAPSRLLCSSCNYKLDRSEFSLSQLDKPSSCCRCRRCENEATLAVTRMEDTRHSNESSAAFFTDDSLAFPFAEGSFRWAALGKYINGPRKGQRCVCKWFKEGHVESDSFYELDIRAMYKALDLVELWNSHNFIAQVIRVNIPEIWVFGQGDAWEGLKALEEPYIAGFQKFNSNTGWTLDETRVSAWVDVMQALSHFTFHTSNGRFLLCDIQGGIYDDSVVLTDPVICSSNREFGTTDLGSQGISTFFNSHVCNQYCGKNWLKPKDTNRYFHREEGTAMLSSSQGGNRASVKSGAVPPPLMMRRRQEPSNEPRQRSRKDPYEFTVPAPRNRDDRISPSSERYSPRDDDMGAPPPRFSSRSDRRREDERSNEQSNGNTNNSINNIPQRTTQNRQLPNSDRRREYSSRGSANEMPPPAMGPQSCRVAANDSDRLY